MNNYFDPQNTLVGETIGLLCWVSIRNCAKTPQGICPGIRVDNHERRKIECQKNYTQVWFPHGFDKSKITT